METDNLNESGLSRVRQHIAEHDCGIWTAWRFAAGCNDGPRYTRAEKNQRNYSLKAKLVAANLGITAGRGVFSEVGPNGKIESNEDVYFVVDVRDNGNLKSILTELGKEFDQDSVLYIPHGEGVRAISITTNNCGSSPVGFEEQVGDIFVANATAGFMTRIRGRTFKFDKAQVVLPEHHSTMTRGNYLRESVNPWWTMRIKDQSLLEFYKTLQSHSSALLSEVKKFDSYKTDPLTAKMWILPDGKPVALDQWHYRWILANKDRVAKFGLDTTGLPDDEDTVRKAALQKGFFRVNYERNIGHLVIEGVKMKLTRNVKDAAFMIVMDNLRSIDRVTLNLMNDTITHLVWNKTATLFSISDEGEKLEAFEKVLP